MATTSRTIVRQGIASYFGGVWVDNVKAYQGGPLTDYGVVDVKRSWGKRIDWKSMFNRLNPGRGMGAFMVVSLNTDKEVREAIAGAPVLDSNGNIIAGGVKMLTYQCTLEVFHLAQAAYAEDAQDDIDLLIEAIKNLVRVDRTLGGICTDAGETSFGIRVKEDHPGVNRATERTSVHFTVQFEVRTQFIA